ncbi:MAG: hypothetical protein ACOYL6_15935 [Bacteriovoracaceae bacterium]
MKKIIFFLFLLFTFHSWAQTTIFANSNQDMKLEVSFNEADKTVHLKSS